MKEKRLIVTGIVLALLVMAVCGIGLFRNYVQEPGTIEATIILSD